MCVLLLNLYFVIFFRLNIFSCVFRTFAFILLNHIVFYNMFSILFCKRVDLERENETFNTEISSREELKQMHSTAE